MTTIENTAPAAEVTPEPLPVEHIAELQAQLAASPTGRVPMMVDPRTLVFGNNIRDEAAETITIEFVQSVIDAMNGDGWEQDPTVWINAEGYLQVKDGQRRTLGAIEAEYVPCPVILRHPPEGDTDQDRRASEISGQWRASEDRVNLDSRQKYNALQEYLTLPGITPTKAAETLTGVDRHQAKAAKALRKARTATRAQEAAAVADLDLVQAAKAAEIQATDQEMDTLIRAAKQGPGSFKRIVLTILSNRRIAAARAEAAASFAERGFTVLDRRPNYEERRKTPPIDELVTHEGQEVTEADIAPKHWAVLLQRSTERAVVLDTGEVVSWADDVDEATLVDPAATPAEGKYHADQVRVQDVFEPEYYCLDRKAARVRIGRAGSRSGADQHRANQRAHDGNAVARVDTSHRRQYVTERDTGKRGKAWPKGSLVWAVHLLLTDPKILIENNARHTAAELLGVESPDQMAELLRFDPAAENILGQPMVSDQRAASILITLAMGAVDARMQPRDDRVRYWRTVDTEYPQTYEVDLSVAQPHLRILRADGHDLGPMDRATLTEISVSEALAEAAPAALSPKTGNQTTDAPE